MGSNVALHIAIYYIYIYTRIYNFQSLFTYIISLGSQNNSVRWVNMLFSFYR